LAQEPPDLANRLELAEAEAWAALADVRREFSPIGVERIGGAVILVDRRSEQPLNRVYGLGLSKPASAVMLEEIMAVYRTAGVERFTVHLSPTARPPALPRWLEQRGFNLERRVPKLYRSTLEPPATDPHVRIRPALAEEMESFSRIRAEAIDRSLEWASLAAICIGQPGWHHYFALDGDKPVGTGAMYVRDGVAWLSHGTTLPSHQRRGIHAAMIAHRLQEAARLGCEWATANPITEAAQESEGMFRNLVRNGFELLYLRAAYVYEETEASSA